MSVYADALLRVTSFVVQRFDGSSWQTTTSYAPGKRYRFRMMFLNTSPRLIVFNGSNTDDVYVVGLIANCKLPFANFEQGTRHFLMRTIGGKPDFNDFIAPGEIRAFEFGTFTWSGPSVPCSRYPVEFYSSHREIRHMQLAPWANLLPS